MSQPTLDKENNSSSVIRAVQASRIKILCQIKFLKVSGEVLCKWVERTWRTPNEVNEGEEGCAKMWNKQLDNVHLINQSINAKALWFECKLIKRQNY